MKVPIGERTKDTNLNTSAALNVEGVVPSGGRKKIRGPACAWSPPVVEGAGGDQGRQEKRRGRAAA